MAALYDYQAYFLNYGLAIYGGSYTIEDTTLFIYQDKEVYKVNLLDGPRFNKYAFFHKNTGGDNRGWWHEQGKYHELEFGLFRILTHNFNKQNNIPFPTKEDWKKFKEDALRYKILNK